jgi:hypothetical protein
VAGGSPFASSPSSYARASPITPAAATAAAQTTAATTTTVGWRAGVPLLLLLFFFVFFFFFFFFLFFCSCHLHHHHHCCCCFFCRCSNYCGDDDGSDCCLVCLGVEVPLLLLLVPLTTSISSMPLSLMGVPFPQLPPPPPMTSHPALFQKPTVGCDWKALFEAFQPLGRAKLLAQSKQQGANVDLT